jgi:threonine dehydrogenase-like Zn-dependent dehydrogenase
MPSDDQIIKDSEQWRDIDVLKDTNLSRSTGKRDLITGCSGKRYLITGCSGNLGLYAIQLLHSRGEREIYCLDISPLPAAVEKLEGVYFRSCDITDSSAVRSVFQEVQPDVYVQ